MKEGKKPKDRDLVPYMAVWEKLGVIKELVCRGERIVIPEWRRSMNDVAVRDWVMDLGPSANQGMDATKRQLKVRLWFPGMDKAVERRVSTCLACQVSVESRARDPLKPSKAPEEPWSRLYTDHWGPTQDSNHILVIIDGLTRYPEVLVVKGTSAEDNIQAFSEVFSRHGVTAHLVVLLEVPVVVSHPRLAAAFSVKSVKSPGIKDRQYSETAEVITSDLYCL